MKINLDSRDLLVLLAFCEKNIVRYVILVMSMIPILSDFSAYIVPSLYVILISQTVIKYPLKIGLREVGVIGFVVFSIFITCLLYPQNAKYIFESRNFWNIIFPCLKYFIVALVIIPDKRTMDLLGKISCLAVVIESLFVFLYMIPNEVIELEDMSRSYQLLPNVLFALNYAFNKSKLMPWMFGILGMVYIIAMGTRGPVIIMLGYFFFKFLKTTTTKIWIKVILFLLVSGFGLLILNSNFYIGVLNWLKNVFTSIGLSTRVIDLIIEGTVITHLSERDELYRDALQKISERPIFGYGVYGEWEWFSWSVHNMYLEFLIHYGVVLGSALLIWLLHLVGKAYISTKNTIARDMILIWFCFVFIRGIFGGSYLMFGTFFLIGFCISEQRRTVAQRNYKYA